MFINANLFLIGARSQSRYLSFFLFSSYPKKTKIVIGSALGAILVLAGTFYCFSKKKFSFKVLTVEERIELMLPNGEHCKKIEKVQRGYSNNIWIVETDKKRYIFRSPKNREAQADFMKMLEISKFAFEQGLAPEIFNENIQEQQILLEHIECIPWPSYEENPSLYNLTMKTIRHFHEKMRPLSDRVKDEDYAPFSTIFKEGRKLEKLGEMPYQFSIALKKVEKIFDQLKPWLKNHATLCHGDFHRDNVLFAKGRRLSPILIDFDAASKGHPFFDPAQFCVALPKECKLKLFKEYLGGRPPTALEQMHFELIDLVFLMVVATLRFKYAHEKKTDFQKILTKKEIEKILDTKEDLPSFTRISFGDTSAKAKQLGAIYALAEFLRKSKSFSFSESLENPRI